MRTLITFFTLLYFSLSYSQIVIETDKTIPESYVNEKAVNYITSNYSLDKLTWLLIENEDNKFIQAKFNLKKEIYTVQFNTNGELDLIEVVKSLKDLDQVIVTNIKNHLKSKFSKYRIINTNLQRLKGAKNETFYRLEIYGKTNNMKQRFRIIFNHTGHFISQVTIKEQPSIYLQY